MVRRCEDDTVRATMRCRQVKRGKSHTLQIVIHMGSTLDATLMSDRFRLKSALKNVEHDSTRTVLECAEGSKAECTLQTVRLQVFCGCEIELTWVSLSISFSRSPVQYHKHKHKQDKSRQRRGQLKSHSDINLNNWSRLRCDLRSSNMRMCASIVVGHQLDEPRHKT